MISALKTMRQERFAMFLARGLSQIDAYSAAGFKRSSAGASRAARRPGIAARVRELQNGAARRARISLTSLLEKLEDARLLAMNEGQAAAAVAAVREMAILTGIRVEKHASAVRTVNELSDEELMMIASGAVIDGEVVEET